MIPPKLLGVMTLVIAMAVESFAQLFLKVGASGGVRVLSSPYKEWAGAVGWTRSAASWTASGVLFYILEIFLYTLVLHWLDVSVAFPMGSLCFVGVALLSKVFLRESVDRMRWLGICCILAGTVLVSL